MSWKNRGWLGVALLGLVGCGDRGGIPENQPVQLKAKLGGNADVVLSDMAANATGHRTTDHLRIMALIGEARRRSGATRHEVLQEGSDPDTFIEMQRGLATTRRTHNVMSRYQEAMITWRHDLLDEWVTPHAGEGS